MVRVAKPCVVNGIEFEPDPDVTYPESRFGPYLRELQVDGSIEFVVETPDPAPAEPERRTAFGTKRK